MNPVKRSLDIRETGSYLSVFGKHSVSDALHSPRELALGMSHEIDIHGRTELDVLHLAFPVVRNHIPLAVIDQREHGGARVSISTFRDIHVGHVGVKRCDDTAAFKIDPSA